MVCEGLLPSENTAEQMVGVNVRRSDDEIVP